ncbi:MAG: GNAT family N-acetyltransferase [archaeon]|nr:GNAT family N-acetyltransferase [archaeon]MCR4323458.1 GNAT family N-acetyltransferase [Nanoarchaeota archaeon]
MERKRVLLSEVLARGIRLSIDEGGREVARAYIYVMKNDLHDRPFGLMEDVFVEEDMRGKGYGTQIVEEVVRLARVNNCYKLICTSKHPNTRAHELYKRLGFSEQGLEFRMNF